jgi:hypothetical protein
LLTSISASDDKPVHTIEEGKVQETSLTKIQRRAGTFGDYTVLGFQYAGSSGGSGWYVTTWKSGRDLLHDYWVDDATSSIREVSCRMDCGGHLLFERFLDPIAVVPEENRAILDAIQCWNFAT